MHLTNLMANHLYIKYGVPIQKFAPNWSEVKSTLKWMYRILSVWLTIWK